MSKKHGWWSDKQRAFGGYCIYLTPLTPGGSKVSVTMVTDSSTNHGTSWDDIRYIGEVETCLQVYAGTIDSFEFPRPDWIPTPADLFAIHIDVNGAQADIHNDLPTQEGNCRMNYDGVCSCPKCQTRKKSYVSNPFGY